MKAIAIGWLIALPAAAQTAPRYDPSRDLGQLFHDVERSGIYPDSKTFVDAIPQRAPSAIVAAYDSARAAGRVDLRAFVERNFTLPTAIPADVDGANADTTRDMAAHIRALWPVLTRSADTVGAWSTLLPLPNPYVVPGGRFREVYYWDSYFTMLGLVVSNRVDLVKSMLDNFAYLVRVLGHIPNGNRVYYTSRSQPAYFATGG